MEPTEYRNVVAEHYQKMWGGDFEVCSPDNEPLNRVDSDFRIYEFPPTNKRDMWTYATVGMSAIDDLHPIELHIFSSKKDEGLISLMQVIAYYHKTGAKLDLHHTVNLGKSWQNNSACHYGYISLPYLDGPSLENLTVEHRTVKFYWLIPITEKELEFKKRNGADALEGRFDKGLNYIDSRRTSLV